MSAGQDDASNRDALALARTIIDTVREPLVVLDGRLRVLQANRAFYETFGANPSETEGRQIFDLGDHEWDIPDLRTLLEQILTGNSAFSDFEMEHSFEGIGRKTMLLNARKLQHAGETLLLAIEDVTDRRRTERSLAVSRQRLQYAAQSAGVGFWYCDLPFDVLNWDERVKAHFQLPPDTPVTIETFYDRLHPDDREPTRRAIDQSIRDRTSYGVDYRTVDPQSGSVKWVRAAGGATYGPDGNPVTFDGLTLDVTDRKNTEAALRRTQERLSLALEASEFVGTWDCDLANGLVTADPRFARLYSVDPARAAEGVPIGEFTRTIHPDDSDRVGRAIERSIAEGSPFSEEYRLIQPDGSARWVAARGQARRDARGEATRFAGVAVDVTDRKAAEANLQESEARFRQLADAMPQIVFAARPDGHVDYFNRRWFEYTGFAADGRTGDESWEAVHEAGQLERVRSVWAEALRTGQPYEIEYRLRRADGAFRWHLGRALPIRDPAGRVVRWFGTNTDIDDQKRAEAAAAEARDEAQAANRMKDEFLATLSHELRTPLNAILGWARILNSGHVVDDDLRDGLAAIERNSKSQAQIIEDLLDISRIVSGNFKLEVQRLDVREVIDVAIATVLPAAAAKGVRIEKVLDSLAGPVSGDPARLQQVVWNLLSNAVKFTPKGGKVQVLLERVNSHVEVSVIDTGSGIKPEFLPHVFDRFRQADSSTTRRHGGLGLGLAIVKQLIELHGGGVRAKSPGEGQGSTFTLILPITVVHPEHPAPEKVRPRESVTAEDVCKEKDLDGVKVLVVDDEADARLLIRRVLTECKAVVALASSAAEALELVEQFAPEVIVSDVGMPEMDGYEFIRRVRARHPSRELPAAALTAFARAEDRRQALLAGFQTHVAKPVDPAELIAVVASLAGRTGTA